MEYNTYSYKLGVNLYLYTRLEVAFTSNICYFFFVQERNYTAVTHANFTHAQQHKNTNKTMSLCTDMAINFLL